MKINIITKLLYGDMYPGLRNIDVTDSRQMHIHVYIVYVADLKSDSFHFKFLEYNLFPSAQKKKLFK